MSEVKEILALSRRAAARGDKLFLATVAHVRGSSYRKPGARMLVSAGGERAGTISGGCLETEVGRRIQWLTRLGPRLECYSSFADEDGGIPYGLGCGGTISVLLETGDAVPAILAALDAGQTSRQPSVVVHTLSPAPGEAPGTLAVLLFDGPGADPAPMYAEAPRFEILYQRDRGLGPELRSAALRSSEQQQSCFLDGAGAPYAYSRETPEATAESDQESLPAYFIEYLDPPPALTIFGAGDDAQPIAAFAHTLGWRVTVADGRAHLARAERFPAAAEVHVLEYPDPIQRAACGLEGSAMLPQIHAPGEQIEQRPSRAAGSKTPASMDWLPRGALAVILTHSYVQDRALLAALLPCTLRYLGILGPRHRTERLLDEVCPGLGWTVEQGFARLHSPIGLDLGSGEPAAVALSIIAEIQAVLNGRHVQVERLATLPNPARAEDYGSSPGPLRPNGHA